MLLEPVRVLFCIISYKVNCMSVQMGKWWDVEGWV